MSLLVLHCFAQLAAEQIRCAVALICSPGAVLANGWAGKNFILGLKLEKAAGKGCPEPRDPAVPLLWGVRGSSSLLFFGMLFPLDPWVRCCPSAPPSVFAALVFGCEAKRNGNQTHLLSFPVISSGFGEREGE